MSLPKVAIIGRPNVGKSSLFNRLIKKRKAVTHKDGGTTRDRLYANVHFDKSEFSLIDTGGIHSYDKKCLSSAIREQTNFAIDEAHLLLFVCDIQEGVTPLDIETAEIIRKHGKKTILVLNKADNEGLAQQKFDFCSLGFKEIVTIAAIHNRGTEELLRKIYGAIEVGESEGSSLSPLITIAIVGRPNVGKSSFLNSLLKDSRLVVDKKPGSTRDSIDTYFEKDNIKYCLIDTAGIRKKFKLRGTVDMYSVLRAERSIQDSDISVMLIDGYEGVTTEDQKILRSISNEGKGSVLAVNKWDLVEKGIPQKKYTEAIRKKLPFAKNLPVVYIRALDGKNVLKVIDKAREVFDCFCKWFPKDKLNEITGQIRLKGAPPIRTGSKPRLYHISQTGTKPPVFEAVINNPFIFKEHYRTFIKNFLNEKLQITGMPVKVLFRKKFRNNS